MQHLDAQDEAPKDYCGDPVLQLMARMMYHFFL